MHGEKIVQVSGFGVANTSQTQCDYMLVGLTDKGRVVLSMGDREWVDVSPKKEPDLCHACGKPRNYLLQECEHCGDFTPF